MKTSIRDSNVLKCFSLISITLCLTRVHELSFTNTTNKKEVTYCKSRTIGEGRKGSKRGETTGRG